MGSRRMVSVETIQSPYLSRVACAGGEYPSRAPLIAFDTLFTTSPAASLDVVTIRLTAPVTREIQSRSPAPSLRPLAGTGTGTDEAKLARSAALAAFHDFH